jgi:ribonuclease HI
MSVKGFLDKYFKPETTKVSPESVVLEPMVGTVPRTQIETKRPTISPLAPRGASPSTVLHLFTDGACSGNGQRGAKGGYGVYVYGKPDLDVSLPLLPNEQQTNNRAELRAIQAALDLLDRFESVWSQEYTDFYIWSDSEYSINCLTKWAKGWRSNGWKKRDGNLVQNLDLIKPCTERLSRMPRVSLHHVRGHQDSKRNEFPYDGNFRADALATQAIH